MVSRTAQRVLPVLFPLLLLAACAPGNRLYVPGDLARPPGSPPRAQGYPQVAVADFAYSAPAGSPEVIGRDYDQVRQIVWKGDPGKAMADLVAAVFSERGVPAVRVKADAATSGNVPYLVSGAVRRFEVNARRAGMVMQMEATVSITVSASGAAVSRPWEATITTSTTNQDVFAVPDELRKALLSAANSAAEEAVRRLREGGVAAVSPADGKGGDGTPR